jgi:hypothetical protein
MRFKDTQLSYTFFFFIMTYETAISALDAARTGDELLQVLDALGTEDSGRTYLPILGQSIPTLEEVAF